MDTRDIHLKINDKIMDDASQFLISSLKELEFTMIYTYKKNKTNDLFIQGCQYKSQMQEAITKLQNISRYSITQLTIENFNNNKKGNVVSDDFRCYVNLIHNISTMIQREITSYKAAYALISMERWIYILKSCHEKHDYFTAATILIALSSISISRSRLEDNLSPVAKAILLFYTKIYSKSHMIHSIQERQHKNGEIIIPMLTPLPAMIDAINNDPDKQYVNDTINSYISLYKELQRDNLYFRSNPDNKTKNYIQNLQLHSDEALQNINYSNAKHLSRKIKKSNFNSAKFIQGISLYDVSDKIYLHLNQLSQLRNFLNEYNNKKTDTINLYVLSQIEWILKEKFTSFEEKSKKMNTILIENEKSISKHLLVIYRNIIVTLADLQPLEQKYQSIEPKPMPTKKTAKIFKSESNKELSLKRSTSKSTHDDSNDTSHVNYHTTQQLRVNGHSAHISRSLKNKSRSSDSLNSQSISHSRSSSTSPRSWNTKEVITALYSAEAVNNPTTTQSTSIMEPVPLRETDISNKNSQSMFLPKDMAIQIKPHAEYLKNAESGKINLSENQKSPSNSPRKLPRKYSHNLKETNSVLSVNTENRMENKIHDDFNIHAENSSIEIKPETHTIERSFSCVITQIENFDQSKKIFSKPLPSTNTNKEELITLQYDVKSQISLINKGIFSHNAGKKTVNPITCDEIVELQLQKNVSNSLTNAHSKKCSK